MSWKSGCVSANTKPHACSLTSQTLSRDQHCRTERVWFVRLACMYVCIWSILNLHFPSSFLLSELLYCPLGDITFSWKYGGWGQWQAVEWDKDSSRWQPGDHPSCELWHIPLFSLFLAALSVVSNISLTLYVVSHLEVVIHSVGSCM